MFETAQYFIVLLVYAARMTTATCGVLAAPDIYKSLKICWKNRILPTGERRPLSSLITLLQPFDLTFLLTGTIFTIAGWTFGAAAFTALDIEYATTKQIFIGDIAVAIAWSMWSLASVCFSAAFSRNPKAKFKGATIIILGCMTVVAVSGRFS